MFWHGPDSKRRTIGRREGLVGDVDGDVVGFAVAQGDGHAGKAQRNGVFEGRAAHDGNGGPGDQAMSRMRRPISPRASTVAILPLWPICI